MKFTIGKIIAMTALVAVANVTFNATNSSAATRAEIKRMVVNEAMNSRVPPSLALAVAKVESDFQERALSTAGARGVMQIMPATAQSEFGVEVGELWNPQLNIRLGIDYLEQLYDQYGGKWNLALSHYNGGTLKGKGANATPHGYTQKYVKSVLNWHRRYSDQATVWRTARNEAVGGWTPARTRINKRAMPRRIVVRELPTASVVRWRSAVETKAASDLDDLSRTRFPTHGPLDDFSPRVTWRDS
jgi:hypothetical protein